MDLTGSERGVVDLILVIRHNHGSTPAQNLRIMDDIVCPWMKHCDEF